MIVGLFSMGSPWWAYPIYINNNLQIVLVLRKMEKKNVLKQCICLKGCKLSEMLHSDV